jgi:hypothetical protein
MTAVASPTLADRLLTAIRAMIRAELPTLTFLGTYEYTITAVNGDGTLDCTPTDPTIPLPAGNGWPMRSCVCGSTATPTVGNRCLVTFANGDPSRPIVVGNDPIVQVAVVDASEEVDIGNTPPLVKIGSSATSVEIGPAPEFLAYGEPVVLAWTALEAWFFAVTAAAEVAETAPDPTGVTFQAFATTVASLGADVISALSTAETTTITEVIKGT